MPRVILNIAQAEASDEEVSDPLEFEIEGQVYTCQEELAEFALLDLAAKAMSEDVMEAGAAFMTFLEGLLIPEDWQRFKKQAIKEKWKSEQMLPLVQQAVEFMVGVPTSPLSGSAAGPLPTGTPSRDVSPSEGGAPVPASV